MLTGKILKAALETSHDACDPECVHAQAEAENTDAITKMIGESIALGVQMGDPMLAIFVSGLHVGYRAHQLEAEASKEA